MTFIAQTYEQFVDDMLTALTGGISREEHRFTGADEPYRLGLPGPIPASIRVFGTHNEAFRLFEGGIDYAYNTEDEAIAWLPDARQPDDQTFFYINYYTQEGRRVLTDRNPGSVTRTLAEAFAREYAVLHKQMELIYESAFVETATNSSLNHVAALLGLTRRDSKFAQGEVLFKRSTPATGDISIPAGTVLSTPEGANFETTNRAVLRKGQLSVVVPVQAQQPGPEGKTDAGTLVNMARPIFGIESVTNNEPTYFANERETDEAFRRRIKSTLERAGKATVNALKYGLIEDVAEITDGNIQVIERPDQLGVVEVKLGLPNPNDLDLVRRVEAAIFEARPVGIRVTHNLPTRTPDPEAASAAADAQISREAAVAQSGGPGTISRGRSLDADVVNAMPEGILRLRANVFLRLAEANTTVAQQERIEDETRSRVLAYIDGLPMGADIVFNKLLGLIVQADDVLDADLALGPDTATDAKDFFRENLATNGRKAELAPENLFVGLMEEEVFLTLRALLEPKPGVQQTVQVDQALDAAVRRALERALVAGDGKIKRDDLQSAISAAIPAEAPLQLAEGDAVTINAEYEDTGRMLVNTQEVALDARQVARLKTLTIEIKGAQDA